MENQYLSIAIQYYIAGRSAVFAGSMPVAGNLFHHAIEMFLKFLLLPHHSPQDLKDTSGTISRSCGTPSRSRLSVAGTSIVSTW